MDTKLEKYGRFALCREMLETASVVRNFDAAALAPLVEGLRNKARVLLTGEGSSRIFPAKRAIYQHNQEKSGFQLFTEGSTQALEYELDDLGVLGASNSGKTKELVRLFSKLKKNRHPSFFGITAQQGSAIAELAISTHVLSCGPENAVAATKSVMEQALNYHAIREALSGRGLSRKSLSDCGDAIEKALTLHIPESVSRAVADATLVYFAGRNNGVAEELALKTNEITRKKSSYLEGTYAVHGIEEVMDKSEVTVIVDPFPDEEEKFEECLVKGVGMQVVAISTHETRFPTILIPRAEDPKFQNYVELAAGWNLLVEAGVRLGIDLDTPRRARKVGNEFLG